MEVGSSTKRKHDLRPRRTSLKVNPSAQRRQDDSESPSPSPLSHLSHSPITPLTARPVSSGSESLDDDEKKPPASGPKRTKASNLKANPEKRKRSRVNPQQLLRLEQIFARERAPTAARRKEISEELGMQERQTQIWFQNRRAKAKLQESKPSFPDPLTNPQPTPALILPPQNTPPESPVSQSPLESQVDLAAILHEDQPITIIPSAELCIGSWRRISSRSERFDLVTYLCEPKQQLTWYIRSEGRGFKMDVPFDIIDHLNLDRAPTGSSRAVFTLRTPPLFSLEDPSLLDPREKIWKPTSDWTEGYLASRILEHELLGHSPRFDQAMHVVQVHLTHLQSSPSFTSQATSLPGSPMDIPLPPMAGLTAVDCQYSVDSQPGTASSEASVGYNVGIDFVEGSSGGAMSNSFASAVPTYTPTSPDGDGLPPAHMYDYGNHIDIPYQPASIGSYGESLAHALSPRSYAEQPLQGPYYEEQPVSRYLRSAPTSPSYSTAFPKPAQPNRLHRQSFPNSMNFLSSRDGTIRYPAPFNAGYSTYYNGSNTGDA